MTGRHISPDSSAIAEALLALPQVQRRPSGQLVAEFSASDVIDLRFDDLTGDVVAVSTVGTVPVAPLPPIEGVVVRISAPPLVRDSWEEMLNSATATTVDLEALARAFAVYGELAAATVWSTTDLPRAATHDTHRVSEQLARILENRRRRASSAARSGWAARRARVVDA